MGEPVIERIYRVRTYKDKAESEDQRFQAAGAGVGVKLGGNVAKMEVREAESVFA